jgi:uncharacterized protein (TIGR02145 family)
MPSILSNNIVNATLLINFYIYFVRKSITLLFLFCTAIFAQQKGTFADPRDGKKYRIVKIGSQTWMAKNLNYNVGRSKCYDNEPANCEKYGRLYDWNTAKAACPKGWHLPSDEEWQTLTDLAGGDEVAGKKLKARSGWYKNGNGTDIYGFAALPGGFEYSDGIFIQVDGSGHWWSVTESDTSYAYNRFISYSYERVVRDYNHDSFLFSVRCLRD